MAKKYFKNYRIELAYDFFFSNIQVGKWEDIHNIVDITSGENLPKHKMIEGEFSVYGGGGKTNNTHANFNVEYETIGIGRVGARCGCVFKIQEKSWVTDNALLIKSYDDRFDLNFLKHYLSYRNLGQFANSSMQPVISKTRIADIKLPVLEISKQIDIARTLDFIELNKDISRISKKGLLNKIALVDDWERLNAEIEYQKELIIYLKQSILQDAIQGELTKDWRKENPTIEPVSELLKRIKAEKAQLIKEKKIKKEKPLPAIAKEEIPFDLPEGWVWCRLGEIYQTTSGGTPLRSNSEYWNGEIKWYKSGELNDGLLSNSSNEYITEKGLKESSATLFPSGTLLIAMYGATAGKLAILKNEATTNQAVCGFYNNSNTSTDFLFYYLRANRSKMIDESWGMSQPNISQTYLRNFVFALPSFEEQKAIVQKIESLMQKCTALEQEIAQSEANADMLMQAVLKEAFEKKEVKEVEGYEEVEYNYVNK